MHTGNTHPLDLLQLKKMKGVDGSHLKIIQKIAAGDYETFGMCLLQDRNGEKVELIKKNNREEGAKHITQAVLKEWLRDGPERSYDHLIECLRESEQGALADDIAERITGGGNQFIHVHVI